MKNEVKSYFYQDSTTTGVVRAFNHAGAVRWALVTVFENVTHCLFTKSLFTHCLFHSTPLPTLLAALNNGKQRILGPQCLAAYFTCPLNSCKISRMSSGISQSFLPSVARLVLLVVWTNLRRSSSLVLLSFLDLHIITLTKPCARYSHLSPRDSQERAIPLEPSSQNVTPHERGHQTRPSSHVPPPKGRERQLKEVAGCSKTSSDDQ